MSARSSLRVVAFAPLAMASVVGCTVTSTGVPMPDAALVQSDASRAPDAASPSCGASTVGTSCTTTAECDDGCFCNGIEMCLEGTCAQRETAPCDDGIVCTLDACDEDTNRCESVGRHEMCADDDLCNGDEECVPFVSCAPGPRLSCVDGDPCTIGSCDPLLGCSYEIRDLDGDGFTDDRCGGDDCDDDPESGATVRPGGVEICDNGIDDDCNRLVDYREASCLAQNDTCETAEMLTGAGTYVRTTRGAAGHYPLGCLGGGVDTVFLFRLEAEQNVAATVLTTTGSGAVSIRSASSCATGPDEVCGAEVVARALPAGDYALVVRTSSATTFTLSLDFDAPTPVMETDVCGAGAVDISGGGTFTGFFADVADDYTLSCRTGTGSAGFRDAAYRLVLDEASDVVLTASTVGAAAGSTFLSLTRDCTSAPSTLACVQRTSAEIRRRSLPAGTYYVLLEAASSTATAWTLGATVTPALPRAEGDACISAVDITDTTVSLPISMLELDTGTTCGGSTSASRDASFTFTTTALSDVILSTSAGATHYLAVSAACGNPASEVFCTSGTPDISHRFLRLPAGTWHVTAATSLTSGTLTASASRRFLERVARELGLVP